MTNVDQIEVATIKSSTLLTILTNQKPLDLLFHQLTGAAEEEGGTEGQVSPVASPWRGPEDGAQSAQAVE